VPAPKRLSKAKVWGIVVGVLVGIGLIGTALGGGKANPGAGAGLQLQTTTTQPPATAGQPTSTPETSAAAPGTAAATSPAAAAPQPVKYSGRGDKILSIKKPGSSGIGFAKFTHSGSANFVVWTVGSNELLVNAIGKYSGTVLFDAQDGADTNRLKIQADGAWTLTLLPIESVRKFQGTITGKGDDVVLYLGSGGVATISHRGQANFIVRTWGQSGPDLLVNEIGNYDGEQLFTEACIVEINADGAWSMTVAAD
jgi:hypothetical protein